MNRTYRTLLTFFAVLAATPAWAVSAQVKVFKTPWCGCCHAWAEAVEKAGYRVETIDLEDLSQVKKQAGVPVDMEACHTAAVDGYFLEGHVPVEAIARLLTERPSIVGIAVPGMPTGSLGMGNDGSAPHEVFAISRDASATPTVIYRTGKGE